jgi:hypothetical protein
MSSQPPDPQTAGLTSAQVVAWFGEPRYSVADLQRAYAEGRASVTPPTLDSRVVEAFDLLGGMWSWSEENGYFATGNTWPLMAGRLLREVVGRPAQQPAARLTSEGPR